MDELAMSTQELLDRLRLGTDEHLAGTIDELEARFGDQAKMIEIGRKLREEAEKVGIAVDALSGALK